MFLILECFLVSLAMTPLVNVMYNGMRYDSLLSYAVWSVFRLLSALVGLSVWVMVYPKRYRCIWLVLACVAAFVLIMPAGLARICKGTVVMTLQPSYASVAFSVGELSTTGGMVAAFFLWMLLYRGPMHHKGVLALVIVGLVVFLAEKIAHVAQLGSIVRNGITLIGFVLYIAAGLFGGHTPCKKPKVITGGWRAFTSFLAYGLPIHVMALIYVFLGIYYARTNALERTLVWLVYKVLVSGMLYLWSKIAVYGAKDDCQALLLVFMMVFMYQFFTELTFIVIAPFTSEFFFMLALKAAMHIAIKGGLLLKLHVKIQDCIRRSKNPGKCGKCMFKLVLKLTEGVSDRSPSNLRLTVRDGSARELQIFLTDLIYSDMSLLSSVICSIGATTVVGFESFLMECFPDTFKTGVLTSRMDPEISRWSYFHGYLVVVSWNLIICFVVLWMFLRDSSRVADRASHNKVIPGANKSDGEKDHSPHIELGRASHNKVVTGVNKSDAEKDHSPHIELGRASHNKVVTGVNKSDAEEDHSPHIELGTGHAHSKLQTLFYKAKMQLHVFEQLFFHKNIFYLYFWSFFISFSVVLGVAFFQWIGFMEDCGFDTDFRMNSSRLQSVPIRVNEVPDKKGCWFYSENASVSTLNDTFVTPVYECIYYYSKFGAYT